MGTYISNIPTPPRIMSDIEQQRLLKATGEHVKGFRDHIIISMALATGLRAHEIVALDVGNIVNTKGTIRRRVELQVFKKSSKQPAVQEILLSESLRTKLAKFLEWKKGKGESLAPEAPLFISKKRSRLSTRQLRHMLKGWQERAGCEIIHNFHALRHTSCSALYRQTKDIRLTQRFARHKSVISTERYAHPNVEDLILAVEGLPC